MKAEIDAMLFVTQREGYFKSFGTYHRWSQPDILVFIGTHSTEGTVRTSIRLSEVVHDLNRNPLAVIARRIQGIKAIHDGGIA